MAANTHPLSRKGKNDSEGRAVFFSFPESGVNFPDSVSCIGEIQGLSGDAVIQNPWGGP